MDVGSTEKNGSQRQKLTRKICKNRKVDFNFKLKSALFLCVNFPAVSLTSVLFAAHKSPQKKFSSCLFSVAEMALPDYEYETLLAMMNGMRMIDMKRYFNVDYTTIYRRKLRIQKKYLHAVSARHKFNIFGRRLADITTVVV